jgi:hypothetical protein
LVGRCGDLQDILKTVGFKLENGDAWYFLYFGNLHKFPTSPHPKKTSLHKKEIFVVK